MKILHQNKETFSYPANVFNANISIKIKCSKKKFAFIFNKKKKHVENI